MKYEDKIIEAMELLSKNEKVLFLGQSVSYTGSVVYRTLCRVPEAKRIELPVIEEAQMGLSIGLSLEGFIPVSIYPRMDFLILAMNQLVNHLDKIEKASAGQFRPKVIIRTIIGSRRPLYPGLQHCSDYTRAFKGILKNIKVIKLAKSKEIIPAYKAALGSPQSTLLIEIADLYEKE